MQKEPGSCWATCAERQGCPGTARPGGRLRVESLWGERCRVPPPPTGPGCVLRAQGEAVPGLHRGGCAGALSPRRWGVDRLLGSAGAGPLGMWAECPLSPGGTGHRERDFPPMLTPTPTHSLPSHWPGGGPRGVPAALLLRVRPGSLALAGARCPLRWTQQVPSGQQGCPWVAAAVLGFSHFPSTFSQGMWAACRLGRTPC